MSLKFRGLGIGPVLAGFLLGHGISSVLAGAEWPATALVTRAINFVIETSRADFPTYAPPFFEPPAALYLLYGLLMIAAALALGSYLLPKES